MRYEAIGLFVERVRLRQPEFELIPENADAVVWVCRGLDGIPPAIELATARVGALSLGEMAERLGHSLNLLSAGPRNVSPRQRTMRATVEWSYALLPEPEHELFERLSVFSGGWTLDASVAVVSGDVEENDVLDLLSRLVEKSLVVAEATQSYVLRYRMLKPIRQYARERLEQSGEFEATKRSRAEFSGSGRRG